MPSGINKKTGLPSAFKHGGRMGNHPEYYVWCTMKERCRNPNNQRYNSHGGRGIKYCERWESYENFILDMGRRPSDDLSLERRNNDGDYEPSNCYWATSKQQCLNRRSNVFITYNGERKTISQWAEHFNVRYSFFYSLIFNKNKSVDDAVQQCRNGRANLINYNGESMKASEWAKKIGVNKCMVYKYISRFDDINEAMRMLYIKYSNY